MNLDHINLTVEDVAATQDFLEKYFGLRKVGAANTNIAFLSDDNNAVISIFKGKNVKYPDTFHIGFIQPDQQHVDALYQRLKDDGFEVAAPKKFHGSWTFYILSPGGFSIEVQCWLGE